MMQATVCTESLCKSFGDNKAVSSISLKIKPGEIFTLEVALNKPGYYVKLSQAQACDKFI